MFCTTDPTPSLSLLETLCRHIVDHQTLPVVRSLFLSRQFPSWPESSSTLLYAKTPLPYPRHFTCQQTLLNMYTHPTSWIMVTHRADTICSVFFVTHLSYYSTCSLPFVTCHVSSLQYISFEYLSCISPVSNINSSSPLLSHFASEV